MQNLDGNYAAIHNNVVAPESWILASSGTARRSVDILYDVDSNERVAQLRKPLVASNTAASAR